MRVEVGCLPVGPGYVHELLPPPAHYHCDVETQNEGDWNQAGVVVTVEDDALEDPKTASTSIILLDRGG